MGLATDDIFVAALANSDDVIEAFEGRIYETAIPIPDTDEDNTPVPYVIVTFDGLENDPGSKDAMYESNEDKVEIGVKVVAKTIGQLHDLTQMVRDTIKAYLIANETAINDYQFSADPIWYDGQKPCYHQLLKYHCDVNNNNDNE